MERSRVHLSCDGAAWYLREKTRMCGVAREMRRCKGDGDMLLWRCQDVSKFRTCTRALLVPDREDMRRRISVSQYAALEVQPLVRRLPLPQETTVLRE